MPPVRSSSARLGSAKEFHDSEVPSPRSALSVVAIVLVVGLAAFGGADGLVVCMAVSTCHTILYVSLRPCL